VVNLDDRRLPLLQRAACFETGFAGTPEKEHAWTVGRRDGFESDGADVPAWLWLSFVEVADTSSFDWTVALALLEYASLAHKRT
jgi:hypothetical protein